MQIKMNNGNIYSDILESAIKNSHFFPHGLSLSKGIYSGCVLLVYEW